MIKVGVTGVGGPAGVITAKALGRIRNFFIIGMDANPLSAGFKFSDKKYVIPYAKNAEFIRRLLKICTEERIDLIIPTVDEELIPLSMNKRKFENIGTKIAVSSVETLLNTLDKYKLHLKLRGFNIPTPETYLPSAILSIEKMKSTSYPLVIKPRVGRGSREVFVCYSPVDLKLLLRNAHKDSFIVQEYLAGDEFSIDTVSEMDGKSITAVPRKRIEVKAGISWRGEIINNNELTELAIKTVEALKIIGPACVQVKLSNNRTPKIFEVNPRIGGTTSLTIKAGVNIPLLTVKVFLGKRITKKELKYKKVLVARYFEDVYFNP